MAKKRSGRGNQKAHRRQNPQAQAARAERQESQSEAPMTVLSPGDRLVALTGEIGRALDANPFAARAVAFVIDYLLCGMIAMVPLVVTFNLLGGDSMTTLSDLSTVGLGAPGIVGVVVASLAISACYHVLVPLRLLPGQTPGKRLTHLELVMLDGTPATLEALFVRWVFMTFAETLCTFASSLVIQLVAMAGGELAGTAYTMIGAAISAITLMRIWRDTATRRALHDLVAGTWVFASRN